MIDGSSRQQTSDLRQEIEALRTLAEAGMGENAKEVNSLAREKLLQMHRARLAANGHLDLGNVSPMATGARPALVASTAWTSGDITALEWVCRLAGTGHTGAERLIERALGKDRLLEAKADFKRMLQLAEKSPPVARFFARVMSDRLVDPGALTYWLDRGGREAVSLAADIRELDRLGYVAELVLVQTFVGQRIAGMALAGDGEHRFRCGDLLAAFVERRWPHRKFHGAAAMKLLERAAELGSRRASESLWQARYEAAPDGNAYLREWLATQPEPGESSATQCMLAGTAIELGKVGASADPIGALRWYAVALGLSAQLKHKPSVDDPETCFAVASAFDRGKSRFTAHDPALALAWYERGLTLGSVRCLGGWISACARGELGLAPDPDAAMMRLNQCIGSGANEQLPARSVSTAIRHKGMSQFASDPASGMKWFEIAALLGDPTACDFLSQLYDKGHRVTRDPEAARFWLEKAAALGDEDAQAKLAGAGSAESGSATGAPEQSMAKQTEAGPRSEDASKDVSFDLHLPNENASLELDTKLELAWAFFDVGDRDNSRALLMEVLAGGNDDQRGRARQMLERVQVK